MSYNVRWLMDRVAERLEFDPTEPNEAFGGTAADPWKRIRDWLNEFYTQLINDVEAEVPQEYFEAIYSFTWPASQQEYTLPEEIAGSRSLFMMDITNGTPGTEVYVYPTYRNGGIWWKERKTLVHPNSTGWSTATNLEWHYMAQAEELIGDAQVPLLVPSRHRFLMVWGTVLLAREEADEDTVPNSWFNKVDRLKESYFLDLAQGRLQFTIPPRISLTAPNTVSGSYT